MPHQGTKDGKSTSLSCSNVHVLLSADNNRTHPVSCTSNPTISIALEMFRNIYASTQVTGGSASKYYEIPLTLHTHSRVTVPLAFTSKMC